MNAYELADEFKNRNWDEVDCVLWCEKSANMLRQQADRIAELEKRLQESALDYISVCSQADEHYARVQELEKDLHMVQRHYDQLNLPDGYVVVCVHCAKELKIEFDESNDLEAKVKKYEEVLNAIANDYHELSDHKIEVQVRNHKKWAREALE